MMRSFIVVALALTLGSAAAQDAKAPTGVKALTLKTLLENQNVRLTEVVVAPGARIDFKAYPIQLVYVLTDGTLVFSPPGKTPFEVTLKAGEASLMPSETSAAVNGGEENLRLVLVEVKELARPASAVMAKMKSKRSKTLAARRSKGPSNAATKSTKRSVQARKGG